MTTLLRLRDGFLVFDRVLGAVVGAAAALALAAAAGIAAWQVFTRFVLSIPSIWSEPVTQMLVIWSVFLGVSLALRTGSLICVDVAMRYARGRLRAALTAAVALAVLSFLCVLAWHGYQILWRVRFQTMAGVGISMAWAYAAIPVGAAFAAVATLARWMDPASDEPDPETQL